LPLAGLVVGVGLVSWVATGGIGRIAPPPTPSPHVSVRPPPKPSAPFSCGAANQVQVSGAIDDCAVTGGDTTSSCSTSAHVLDAIITIQGIHAKYILYVEVDGNYIGPGTYSLPPWPHAGLDENDGTAKVAVREYVSGAFWQSVGGILGVDQRGRSGYVRAQLSFVGGEPTPPVTTIQINGAWTCG
jgi:hypothetical protein